MDEPSPSEPEKPSRAAEARAAELVGKVVSQRYRIDELLALGGMGAVYRGHHRHLRKRVAIKVLLPETDNLPEMLARFEREAIAGAHVVHPNVAPATDFGQLEDGSHFLVLEYVSGKTLHEVMKEGPLPPARAAHIARQIAAALQAAHAMGIVHRDLKPRNVMLVEGKGDLAKLIDFGLAKVPVDRVLAHQSVRPPAATLPEIAAAALKAPRRPRLDSVLDDRGRLTEVGTIVGTVAYLAPEAALGMDHVDARADLYALGLVLYQMLAGRYPWDAETDAAIFTAHRFTPPPPFAERVPGIVVPPALEAVVMKLLEKDPAHRYPTGAAVVEALDAAIGKPGEVAAHAALGPAAWLVERARHHLPMLVAAVSIAVGIGAALVLHDPSPARRSAASAHLAAPAPTPTPPPAIPTAEPSTHAAPPPPAPTASPVAAAATDAPVAPESFGDTRALLLRALRVHDWAGGETAFLDLAAHDPGALRAPDISLATRDLAVALERDRRGDRLFEALTDRLGTEGLDLLYDLVATRGKVAAALRAAEVLRKPEVIARATPELRIAFVLREAPCIDKLGLLDRAVAEGDSRTLVVLQTQGVACFRRNNKALQEAMAGLRTKLRRGP